MSSRGYIATFATLALGGLALIAVLGFVVDGYGLFGTRLIPASRFPPNVRLLKHWDRLTKAIEMAERQGDQFLIVGDSRSQHGLDPDAIAGIKGYNGALAAATLAEQMVVVDYALKHEPTIKHIVWGQSYESFPFEIFPPTDFKESAFAGRPIFLGLLRHLFDSDRVLASFKALLQARHAVRAPMKRNGVVTYSGDPVEGPVIETRFETDLAGKARELTGPMSQEAIDDAQDKLAHRLRELKAAGIDVDIVIVPMYIWRLEFLRRIGVEAQSDAWKRRISATLNELAAAPGTGKLRLFDFARPHPLVEQSVFVPPPPGERRYYLEDNHFYPWLGDKVLTRVFAKGEDDEAAPGSEPFGREIGQAADSMSIDSDIATARVALDLWESTHADEVSLVRKLIGR
jgi:hypothetical protein